MGCHTWFYRKADPQPTYEEIRQKLLELYAKERGYYERHVSNTLAEDEKWLFDDKTIQDSEYAIVVLTRIISRIEKRLCKVATMRRIWQVSKFRFCERNQQAYEEVGLHDLFRIGKYPEDELLSLEETLSFIEAREKEIAFGPMPTIYGKDEVIRRLKEFWEQNPEGMIRFG